MSSLTSIKKSDGTTMPFRGRQGTAARIVTATTTTVKSGAGFCVLVRCGGGTLGNVTIYDNTAGSGTVLFGPITPDKGQVLLEAVEFGTGLTIVTAAATELQVSYQ
jgi:hypothetical protein